MKKCLLHCMATLFLVSLLTVGCAKKAVTAPKGTYRTTQTTTGTTTNSDGQNSHNGCGGGDHSNSSGSGY